MPNLNKVMLMGNLTRDIELRHIPSGQAVANIGLAINRTYFVGDGPSRERREETTFVDCEAWGRQAEIMSQYLSKGRPVFIEGRLKLDQWQDQQGNNRSKMRVVVESFEFIDARGGEGGGGGGGGRTGRASDGGGAGSGGGGDYGGGDGGGRGAPYGGQDISEDDIPF